jgi:arginyl-tRNA synthetase
VEREYFVNDARKSNQIQELGKTALGKGETYLNDDLKLKINKVKSKLKNIFNDGEAGNILCQEIQKENKNFIENKLKIKFNKWFSEEQELFKTKKVEKAFQWLKGRGLTYEKEGAVWLKTSEFGDEKDWVIVRSDGEPSYFLSDIVYHKEKFDRGYSKVIDIWGADHQGHVGKMKAASKILENKTDFEILVSQLVRLKSGKMSKRTGEIIALEELVDEVGLDVARFFYSTKALGTQMEFDFDLAKEQSEKNPVYYIQYAYARMCSILEKIKGAQYKSQSYKFLSHESELGLVKQLIKFPEIIEETAKDYQIQRISQYSMALANSFHRFYCDCRVITDNKILQEARINLILATKDVLKKTLDLMGVSAPQKM